VLRPGHRRRQDAADGRVHRVPSSRRTASGNFLILAPNLTIYSKLVQDFTAHTAKYVFQGIADFAVRPPAIITGDDFEAEAAAP
jgi:hypothetical protein